MKFVFPIFCVGAVSAICISPKTPDLRTCAPCDDIRGSQCVTVEGRWLTCYNDYQQCCSDWEVKNHQLDVAQCVSDSQNAAAQPTTPSPANLLPDVTDVCKQVASRGTSKTNIECMNECNSLVSAGGDPKSDAEFNQTCVWAHWHAKWGRTVVDGPCFEKWIYGYSQENALASFVRGLHTDTPAQCQALCQDNDACINWAWVSELYKSAASEPVGRCMLKDETMVSKALSIRTDIVNDPSMDTKYCNYGMPHECSTNHYVCLPCNGGQKRCVWESDMHVTGWKYCTPIDTCSPFPYPPTEMSTVRITTQKPTTATPKPTTATPKPATATPKPTTAAPKPATATPKPTTETPKPTTATPKPATATPKPTTATPKPATATPKPTTATPKPATATPKPTRSISKQTTATPKATKATPVSTPAEAGPSADASTQTPTTAKLETMAPTSADHNSPQVVASETNAVHSATEQACTEAPDAGYTDCPCAPANEGAATAVKCDCHQPKQDCSAGCLCQGKPDCACCNPAMLLIRLSERAKKFQVNLEN